MAVGRKSEKKNHSNESYKVGQDKLHAGGNWNNGSNCGSQCRNLNNWPWNANSNIGRQFCADPGENVRIANSWLILLASLEEAKYTTEGLGG